MLDDFHQGAADGARLDPSIQAVAKSRSFYARRPHTGGEYYMKRLGSGCHTHTKFFMSRFSLEASSSVTKPPIPWGYLTNSNTCLTATVVAKRQVPTTGTVRCLTG